MHFLGAHDHVLLLILVNTYGSLKCHLNLAVIHISLVNLTHINIDTILLLRLVINLFKLGLLIVMHFQNWMTISTFITVHSLDRHHASPCLSNIRWSTKWCQLYPSFSIKFAMVYLRTIHHISLVIKSHDSILLVLNLLFCKIRTVFAFISRHFEVLASSLGLILVFKRWNIGTTVIILGYFVIHSSALSISALFSEPICFSLCSLITWHWVAVVTILITSHWLISISIMMNILWWSWSWKHHFLIFKFFVYKVFVSCKPKLRKLYFLLFDNELR